MLGKVREETLRYWRWGVKYSNLYGNQHGGTHTIKNLQGRWTSEFEASLVYRVSSRRTRATQRNPVSKKKQNKTKTKSKQTKKPITG